MFKWYCQSRLIFRHTSIFSLRQLFLIDARFFPFAMT